ncbi:MAG: hypothetical protein ACPG8W_16980 [Candidatus Promineifilaceae bacterium]
MEELLKAIMGAAANGGAQQRPSSQQDPLAEMLGGILGGGNAAPSPAPSSGGIDIADLIGAVIGQNATQGQTHQNGIADMIGAIMGGGAQGGVNPIAQMIADKTGIPVAIAQMAVAYFMSKMFQGQSQSAPRGGGGGFQPRQAEPNGLDLDDLLDSMGNDSGSLGTHFANNGMASELAQKTGLSENKANETLQEIMSVIGRKRSRPNPVNPRAASLKGLLDNW